jgi:NitT/TauT family transport system substrate-binding protein
MISRRSYVIATASALVASTLPLALRAQAAFPIRIGATANDTYAEAYYALDQGFFAKAGLDATITTLNNGAAVSAAVAAGSLDVGVSGPIQTAQAYTRGVPFTIVAAGALSTAKSSAALLCVPKASPIQGAKDLEGKAIAVNALRTTGDLSLHVWLAKNGIDAANVHVVEVPMSEMGSAVETGRIGAAVISEPSLSIALRANSLRVLSDVSGAMAPQYLVSGWFASKTFVHDNAETVRRFVSAMYATARWANAHQNDSAVILAKVTKMDVAQIRAGMRAPYTDVLRASDIQPQLDLAVKYGYLVKPVTTEEIVTRV